MTPYWQAEGVTIYCADVREWAEVFEGAPAHALLADPPYELAFMQSKWDATGVAFRPDTWAAFLLHLHPGAFGFAFCSSRGWHRQAVAVEDAGFRLYPSVFVWATGSSFPKATRIDTQVDAAVGAEREPCGFASLTRGRVSGIHAESQSLGPGWSGKQSIPATDLARTWSGHRYGGQVLKDAAEPILCFAKTYEGRPVECITRTGAGSLWIDGGRVACGPEVVDQSGELEDLPRSACAEGYDRPNATMFRTGKPKERSGPAMPNGRWPPNLVLCHNAPRECPNCGGAGCDACDGGLVGGCRRVGTRRVPGDKRGAGDGKVQLSAPGGNGIYNAGWHGGENTPAYGDADGSEEVAAWECEETCPVRQLDAQAGERRNGGNNQGSPEREGIFGVRKEGVGATDRAGDSGPVSRFFPQFGWEHEVAERIAAAAPVRYQAKAGRRERDAGLDGRAKRVKLRADLTPEQRAYVLRELRDASSHRQTALPATRTARRAIMVFDTTDIPEHLREYFEPVEEGQGGVGTRNPHPT